ncbi:MAG: hypothetical protein ABIP97_08645, partial [Chthoniobacterales bacterium]
LEKDISAEMVFLQIESQNIAAKSMDESVWDFKVLEHHNHNTLLSAIYVTGSSVSFDGINRITACAPSIECWAFENAAVTLWKELGHWNCAVMDGRHVIAAQRLGSREPDSAMAAEILCLCTQLEAENLSQKMQRVIVWDTHDFDFEILSDAGITILQCERPQPQYPNAHPKLLPFEIREKIANKLRYRQLQITGKLLGAIAALLFIGLIVHTAWMWFDCRSIASYLEKHTEGVSDIRRTVERWNALTPAVDPEQSALEIFYRCARHLPVSGLHFTLFQYKPEEITIVGEGDSVPGVVEFQNQIAKDKELIVYEWKIPPPRILPNSATHFEISGIKSNHGNFQDTE